MFQIRWQEASFLRNRGKVKRGGCLYPRELPGIQRIFDAEHKESRRGTCIKITKGYKAEEEKNER